MVNRVGQQLGNYRLIRSLGRGGQAEVYLGEHRYLQSYAALKVLLTSLDDQRVEQFLAEAQTLVRLAHPSIVRVLDFTVEQGTPVLIMDYAPAGTMRQRYPDGICLPLATVVSSVSQIAAALQYAHSHNVIHRDVKPENLLLGPQGQVLLSDFGLAVLAPSPESMGNQALIGTLPYMAPEQLHGHPSFASDQYTLGVITYEWLCGKRPFTGPQWPLIYQHLYTTPPPLREHNPAVPANVESVVLRALSKDPRERYVSIQGFAYALARASQEMLHARPEDLQKTLLWPSPQLPLAGPQGEVLISASPHNGHTFTPPPHVQRESAQDPGISLQVRDPSSQHQVKTEQVVSSSKDANRQRLLAKVRAFWITGVLEHSLHGAALIALGLHEQAEAIANPWHLVLASSTEQTHELPPRTPIAQVYADALGELLILGEPGSGKTTLLLELARTLLDRASQDGSHPMPVVFNLSSWAGKRQPLSEWIIEELNTKYQVPRKLATTWVESEQILPLLDGLDEVASTYRMACAEAINVYRLQHGLIPTVVCSRSAQYWAQPMHLLVRKAVVVQPLTQHQIDGYLASAGGQLDSVRIALRTYPALRELATTPLMLSVLTLTYHGTSAEDLLVASSPQAQRRLVFERYVECTLVRRPTTSSYSPQQTIHWLAWLARQMKQQSQTVFYIEQLQPNWLSGNRMHWLYDWLAIRLPGILIGILVGLAFYTLFFGVPDPAPALDSVLLGGLLGGILSGGSVTQRSTVSLGKASSAPWPRLLPGLGASLLYGLIIALKFGLPHGPDYEQLHDPLYILRHGPPHIPIYGLNVGLGYGLVVGLCSILFQVLLVKRKTAQSPSWTAPTTWATRWQRLKKSAAIRNGLLVGLLFGLSYGVTRALSYGLSSGLTRGLTHGLAYGLMGGVLSLLLIGRSVTVQPTDRLSWSWRSLISKEHMSATLQATVLIGLLIGLNNIIGGQLIFGPIFGLSYGLTLGLSYGLLLGLFQGVSSETIEDQHRVVPNQGIRRSAFNALMLGIISTVILGLSGALSYDLTFSLSAPFMKGLGDKLGDALNFGLLVGVSFGLITGLLAGLLNGGVACIRHWVLRFLLWRAGSMPWDYPHYLDFAAERILLRKVGGGYLFIHRLLLEHFASLETDSVDMLVATSGETSPTLPSPALREPSVQKVLPDPAASRTPQALRAVLSKAPPQAPRLLPCGHEQRSNARFCAICGASVPPTPLV